VSRVLPAEFAPHQRTVVCWPARGESLYGAWTSRAEEAHVEVARAIARFEPVTVICDPRHIERAAVLEGTPNVEVLELPIDDGWFRDSGPIFVLEDGVPVATSWRFNGWGGKFVPHDLDATVASRWAESRGHPVREVPMVLEGGSIQSNGAGLIVTTMQCLLHPNRNPGMSMAEIESTVLAEFGAEELLWLPWGLALDDDTDGHVDNVAAFAAERRLVVQGCDDPSEDDHARMHANELVARHHRFADGGSLEVVTVPVLPFTEVDGERVAVPYVNYYVGNGFVLVPVCGHPADGEMASLIGEQYPGREVVALDVGAVLAKGGGGIHCITQQVPARA